MGPNLSPSRYFDGRHKQTSTRPTSVQAKRLNGMNVSSNGKFRDEYLNAQWFKNRIDAKILTEDFRRQSTRFGHTPAWGI